MIFVWINKRNWKMPGPIVNVAVHNAASFAALGYETHLCIGAGPDSDTDSDLQEFYGLPPRKHFAVHRVPRFRLGSSSYSASVFHHACGLIRELSQKDHVTVITRESGFLAPLAWLCRHPKISGFYELHDFYADLSWVENRESGHYREKLYEHLFLPRLTGLICITQEQQKLYRQVFPSIPSCAFPLGTKPVSARDTEARRQRRTLMYVGRMHGEKGIDFLLRTAARLSASGIRTLFWGGKAEKIPFFREKARRFGADGFTEFVPFQPPVRMHRALAEQASLGVVMLQDTFYNRYLTCPVKALDYLSHGIPAIGSDIPSVREVLGDAGIYMRPDDTDGFVRSVETLLDDPATYEKAAAMTRQRAGAISWENRARNISAFAADLRKHHGAKH
ncbi:hypothetical protein DENIS_2595 [Desulfonema ishimotonii]|uniref:Uncharacterized protein n=1 Tax=Desulfonema ishimotonii TaxID=45657 RepID=A0A401FXH9_9BACT|nr:glycosyltransferase [Desulfonema ishimotonii]GBC61633.1 hypothetical protein DENIS_2595 [Desulfonema ishimotonii]